MSNQSKIEYGGVVKNPTIISEALPQIDTKGLADRAHANALGYSYTGNLQEVTTPETDLNVRPDVAARVYQVSPLVNSLIRVAADAFSTLPLNVLMRDRKANGSSKRKYTGQPYEVLNWVNNRMTLPELLANTYSWYRLLGVAYWSIEVTPEKYRDISPISIYPLNPLYVKIIPDPETGVKQYVYSVDGAEKIYIPEENIIEFRTFNPRDHWLGNIDLNTLDTDIQIERYTKRQLKNFQANASLIYGILMTEDEVGPDEIRRLKREFQEQYAGAKNAYRILVLEKGMQYEPLKSNGTDQFMDQMLGFIADSHAMVLGVPISLLTAKIEGNAKLIEIESLMWKQNLKPFALKVQSVLTKKLCLGVNELLRKQGVSSRTYIEFDFSQIDALRIEQLNRVRAEVAQINSGIMTLNEVRIEYGLEPFSGEYAEYANAPVPYFNLKFNAERSNNGEATGTSPSMTLPGSEGGRDQSDNGEAQMADETGRR